MKLQQDAPVLNPTFQIKEVEATATEARLTIEPLEPGYGHTVGNALRRVLLTSLPGMAITTVRIKGVDHKYSSLDGMSEDIIEVLLNLKQVRIKANNEGAINLTLSAKGAGSVTAAAIEADAGAEIINKDLHIATLGRKGTLEVEMVAEPGFGYVVAEERDSSVVGEIPVDALYSPVVKVKYDVQATRVGRRTDYDRIVMDVQTDGTISPLEAVEEAARVLAAQFTQVFDPVVIEEKSSEPKLSPEEAEVLRLTVEELDLPTRIANALRKGGFKTVGDLAGTPRAVIAKVKNLGEKSVDVIQEALDKKDVSLGE